MLERGNLLVSFEQGLVELLIGMRGRARIIGECGRNCEKESMIS